MQNKELKVLSKLYEELGAVILRLGGNSPASDSGNDGNDDVLSQLQDLSLEELKDAAKALELATPRQLGRMKQAKMLALFDDVDAEDLAEVLDTGGAGGGEEVQDFLESHEAEKDEWKALAIHLKAIPPNARPRSIEKIQEAIYAADLSLDDVEQAVNEVWGNTDPDDDPDLPDDDTDSVEDRLKELSVAEVRDIAVSLGVTKKKESAKKNKKTLIPAILEESSVEEIEELLDEQGGNDPDPEEPDDDTEEKQELLNGLRPKAMKELAVSLGLVSERKVAKLGNKKSVLIALFEETPYTTLVDELEETTKPEEPKPAANRSSGKRRNLRANPRRRVQDSDPDTRWG